eukprot:jgi/Mesvir1/5208/Mv15339-RA.1
MSRPIHQGRNLQRSRHQVQSYPESQAVPYPFVIALLLQVDFLLVTPRGSRCTHAVQLYALTSEVDFAKCSRGQDRTGFMSSAGRQTNETTRDSRKFSHAPTLHRHWGDRPQIYALDATSSSGAVLAWDCHVNPVDRQEDMSIPALIQSYEVRGPWSDASLVVEGRSLFVNRAILSASSSIFNELFLCAATVDASVGCEQADRRLDPPDQRRGHPKQADGLEPALATVPLHGKTLGEVALWLAYVHPLSHDTRPPPVTEASALSLLSLADEYDCPRLTCVCEDYFLGRHAPRDAHPGSISQHHGVLADRFRMRRLLKGYVGQIRSPAFPLYRHSTGSLPPWDVPAPPAAVTNLLPLPGDKKSPALASSKGRYTSINGIERGVSCHDDGHDVHLHSLPSWQPSPVSVLSGPDPQEDRLSPAPELLAEHAAEDINDDEAAAADDDDHDHDNSGICLASILGDKAHVERLSHAALVQVVRALYLRTAHAHQAGLMARCLLSDARKDVVAFLAPAEGAGRNVKQLLVTLDRAMEILAPS